MKYLSIKKRIGREPVFIADHRGSLPKPKIPNRVFFKVHKIKVNVDFVYND